MTDPTEGDSQLLLLDVPVGTAPLDQLLSRGHATRRRRRVLASAASAVAIVLSGGVVAAGANWRTGDGPDQNHAAKDSAVARELETDVSSQLTAPHLMRQVAGYGGPVWDAERETLYYLTRWEGSSTCPPGASAEVRADTSIVLDVHEAAPKGSFCTADLGPALVIVHDVNVRPAEVTVTEDGRSVTTAVETWRN